jgi:hypothetical protein
MSGWSSFSVQQDYKLHNEKIYQGLAARVAESNNRKEQNKTLLHPHLLHASST